MNVLWLKADYLLPLDLGEKKRTFNLLKHLRSQLAVAYIGYVQDLTYAEQPGLGDVVEREETTFRGRERRAGMAFDLRVAANIGSPYPYFVKRNIRGAFKDQQRRLFREGDYDLIVCDGLDMVGNVDFALPVPKILLSHGVETMLWQQRYETSHGLLRKAYFNYETKRWAAFESEWCNRFDLIIAVSESDRERLESDFKVRVPIEVVATGVDCPFFAPRPEVTTYEKRLVFTGSGDMLSNIDGLLWFAAEAYPIIKKSHPDISLDIIGPNPATEIRTLARKDRSIRVTGWVEDVRPYLAAGDIYIVPLRVPGGTRVKVYEAMAMRKPVVSTNHGIEGLPVADGVHLLVVENARDFAVSIIDLIDHPEKKLEIAENGWRMVNEKYDWSVMAARLAELFSHQIESALSV